MTQESTAAIKHIEELVSGLMNKVKLLGPFHNCSVLSGNTAGGAEAVSPPQTGACDGSSHASFCLGYGAQWFGQTPV